SGAARRDSGRHLVGRGGRRGDRRRPPPGKRGQDDRDHHPLVRRALPVDRAVRRALSARGPAPPAGLMRPGPAAVEAAGADASAMEAASADASAMEAASADASAIEAASADASAMEAAGMEAAAITAMIAAAAVVDAATVGIPAVAVTIAIAGVVDAGRVATGKQDGQRRGGRPEANPTSNHGTLPFKWPDRPGWDTDPLSAPQPGSRLAPMLYRDATNRQRAGRATRGGACR